jgi:hypothetical protein
MTMPILLIKKGMFQSFIQAANLVNLLLALLIVIWEEAISCFSARMDSAGIRLIVTLLTRLIWLGMNTFHRVLFFISASTPTAGTGHDGRYSLELSVRCKERLNSGEKNF